jgi:hypothetical protein
MEQSEEIQNENEDMNDDPEFGQTLLDNDMKEMQGELPAGTFDLPMTEEKRKTIAEGFIKSISRTPKLRGVGVTRKDKSSTKKADKLSRKQRQKNRKIASKKSRPTGSKQRK